jgi:hypothetical protein
MMASWASRAEAQTLAGGAIDRAALREEIASSGAPVEAPERVTPVEPRPEPAEVASTAAPIPPPPPAPLGLPPLYERGDPVPSGYHLVGHRHWEIFGGGFVVWQTAYAPMAFYGVLVDLSVSLLSGHHDTSFDPVFIPVAGPLIVAERFHMPSGPWTLMAIDAAFQAAGVATMIVGLIYKKPILVRDEASIVSVVPVVTNDVKALTLAATF